jgi:hypothetical protein
MPELFQSRNISSPSGTRPNLVAMWLLRRQRHAPSIENHRSKRLGYPRKASFAPEDVLPLGIPP